MRVALICIMSCLFFSANVSAKDDRLKFPIEPLLSSEKAKQALLNVPVYFAGQSHAEPLKNGANLPPAEKPTRLTNQNKNPANGYCFLR